MRTSRDHDSPSFSSTLLDQIYRSIDEGETKSGETNFYRQQQTTSFNKQTDTKHNNIPRTEQKLLVAKDNSRKSCRQRHHEIHDKDVLFFSSTSISSDSSSSVFSSCDTDSLSRASCFASQWPKPVRTSASFRFEKEKQGTRVFDGLYRNYDAKQSTEIRGEEALLIKNKSRALKIYNNLKKVKQPISPGGKLTSFLNSLLFTAGNNVKKKSKGTCEAVNSSNTKERSVTCSSTRSCLRKTTSSYDGEMKTVRFVPVEEKESRVVIKEAARKFLNEYRNSHKKNDLPINHYDDDDVASCASSDLFELDHLDVLGDSRYCEDLPVYETTRISTNRAIANGLIV